MRTAFIQGLVQLAEHDDRIWLVCGDLGYSVLEAFSDRFPERFLNAGVAEQNMTGVAAGLALMGKTVFTYSIANFPSMRCLEQVRNDVCYHNLNVKIVAVGGGLAYGSHGYTHHAVEDLAVMSVLPNMTVVAPGDPVETREALRIVAAMPGPAYLRLGKAGEPDLHAPDLLMSHGRAIRVRKGHDLTLISTGGMLANTLSAADKLTKKGYSVNVLSMPFVVPLDQSAIQAAILETGVVLTIEEHGCGGLGSAVSECVARFGKAASFVPLRLQRDPIKTCGSQEELRQAQGLSAAGIARSAEEAYRRRPSALAGKESTTRRMLEPLDRTALLH